MPALAIVVKSPKTMQLSGVGEDLQRKARRPFAMIYE